MITDISIMPKGACVACRIVDGDACNEEGSVVSERDSLSGRIEDCNIFERSRNFNSEDAGQSDQLIFGYGNVIRAHLTKG